MKLLLYGLAVASTIGYTLPNLKAPIQMAGAYRMLSQVFTIGGKDTAAGDIRQLKIYTADHMMYANLNKSNPDSVSSFGIGSYSIGGNKVIENIFYRASGANISSEKTTFSLDITETPKGFRQHIPDLGPSQGRRVALTEEYEKIGTATKSPLDGAWKKINSYTVAGKDTITDSVIQFKTYYAGHFIWGHAYKDSTNKNHSGIGFGTFKFTENNKIQETIITSTFSSINGKTFDIDIKMNGNDEFQQTGSFSPGQIRVEIYQRLKK